MATKIGKKPFKETATGKILKGVFNGAMDVLPIPDLRNIFDKNEDGKINYKDLRNIKWFHLAGAVGVLAVLIKLEIVDPIHVFELIKLFLGS